MDTNIENNAGFKVVQEEFFTVLNCILFHDVKIIMHKYRMALEVNYDSDLTIGLYSNYRKISQNSVL